MKLRGIQFGHVFNSSGARGFRGEGYWFHDIWRPFGLDYTGSTFVAKTTTLLPRKGNMQLDVDSKPIDLRPDCIVVKMRKGVVLNAVGLSGPGALGLMWQWKKLRRELLVISVMSVAETLSERLLESKAMFDLLKPFIESQGPDRVALQINFSCPNVKHNWGTQLIEEVSVTLGESRKLGVATMIKLNALVATRSACAMADHPDCDAVVVSNTIPWGQLPDRIDWQSLFGSTTSPIAKYGSGGLSGKPLLPIVVDWIRLARQAGITKPIIGGGGILSIADAAKVLDAGADAIELGSVSILRPWRVRGIIQYVNTRLGGL